MKTIKRYIAIPLLLISLPAHAGFIDDLIFDMVKDAIINAIAESLGESAGLKNIKDAADAQRKTTTKHLKSYNSKLYGLNYIGDTYGGEALNGKFDSNICNGYFVDEFLNGSLEKKISDNKAIASHLTFPSEESFLKKEQLKNFMSTKTYDYWTRARNKCTDDVLMNSLFSNPCLLSVFENDNQLLDVYVNNSQGNLKDDVNVLCYLKNMNRFSVLWDSISKQKGIFDASNVHLVNDAIFEGNSSIGNIASSGGYTIRCANKKLLDLYPMGQTEYIKNSCTWKTDAQGRPIVANVIVQRIEKKKIDDEKMLCTQFIKNNFNVWGHSKKNEEQKSDCIFLLIPSFYGGECSFINQVVVDKSVLKTSKKIQKMVKKALKKNVSVKYEVIIDYPDNSTFRPKNVRFSLIENGVQTQTTLVKN